LRYGHYERLNRRIGDIAYDSLMAITTLINGIWERFGLPYWSVARWAKSNVAQAELAIRRYQDAVRELAR